MWLEKQSWKKLLRDRRTLWGNCSTHARAETALKGLQPIQNPCRDEKQLETRSTRGEMKQQKKQELAERDLYTVMPISCVTQHLIKGIKRDWVLERTKEGKQNRKQGGETINCSQAWETGRYFHKCAFNCLWQQQQQKSQSFLSTSLKNTSGRVGEETVVQIATIRCQYINSLERNSTLRAFNCGSSKFPVSEFTSYLLISLIQSSCSRSMSSQLG